MKGLIPYLRHSFQTAVINEILEIGCSFIENNLDFINGFMSEDEITRMLFAFHR